MSSKKTTSEGLSFLPLIETRGIWDHGEHRLERHARLSRERTSDDEQSRLLLQMLARHRIFFSREIEGSVLSEMKLQR